MTQTDNTSLAWHISPCIRGIVAMFLFLFFILRFAYVIHYTESSRELCPNFKLTDILKSVNLKAILNSS